MYKYMNYYRKPINKVINDVKLKMQLGALTLKISENNNKIDDLIGVDKNIKKDVSTNLGQISTNKSSISNNSEQINDIKSLLPTSEIFKKTYSITNQSFRFTRNIVYFKLLEKEIENNFNKNGKLEVDNYIYYKYDNLQGDHHRLQHEYRILDDKNNLLYKKILNKTNTSDLNFDNNIMLVKDNFYVTFNNNYNKIKIILDLYRVYRHGSGYFNLELINESFVNIKYLYKNDTSLKIDTNENNISTNLSKISTNTIDVSSNLGKINDNSSDISTNLKQISTNTESISSNLGKINDISSNLKQIDTNKNDISTNSTKIDNFTQYILQSGKDFEEKYTIEKQIFKFNKDKHFYAIFEKEIEYDFTKNSLLFVKNNMYYKYENLSNDYHRLQHEYNIYDGDNLIHKYLFNKDTYYDENLNPILHTNEDFCICFKKIIKKLN